jgi:acetyl/propionyl-CoA carboxylase alpha subunit
VQKTIENFFTYDRESAIRQSKRMVNAINLFKSNQTEQVTSTLTSASKRTTSDGDINLSEDEQYQSKEADKAKKPLVKAKQQKMVLNPKKKNPSKKASTKADILIENSNSKNSDSTKKKTVKRKSTESLCSRLSEVEDDDDYEKDTKVKTRRK